jgi:hypothetical protein
LYTHRRNKHNVISVSKKQDIFKIKYQNEVIDSKLSKNPYNNQNENDNNNFNNINQNLNKLPKKFSFTYKLIGHGTKLNKNFFEELKIKLQKYIHNFYDINKKKLFINDDFFQKIKNGEHNFMIFLEKYKNLFSKGIEIPKPDSGIIIDEIFLVYFILIYRVANYEILIEKILNFILLFREFINCTGWDFYEKNMILNDLYYEDIEINKIKSNCFSENNFIDYLPDFINDFIQDFLNIDEDKFGFNENFKEIEDLSMNFFEWLYNNNFTNLKISLNCLKIDKKCN